MKYKILPHTADLRLKVYGKNEEDLFINALQGLAVILKKDIKKLLTKKPNLGYKKIRVEGKDLTEVLVNFLSDVLTNSYIDKKIYPWAKILKLTPQFCEAQIFGWPIDGFDRDIKAVTHHQAKIEKDKKKNLKVLLILDI